MLPLTSQITTGHARQSYRLAQIKPGQRRRQRHHIDLPLAALDFVVVVCALMLTSRTAVGQVAESALLVLLIGQSGSYRTQVTLSTLDGLPRLAGTTLIAVFVTSVVFDRDLSVQRALILAAYLIAILVAVRLTYYSFVRLRRKRSINARRRTAIIGGGMVAKELIESIGEHPELGLETIVVVDNDPLVDPKSLAVPVVSERSLHDLVNREQIETLIVAFQRQPDSTLVSTLRECGRLDCEVFVVPRLFEFVNLGPGMDRVHTVPLIRVRRSIHRSWSWYFKRVLDFSAAGCSLILLSPLMALTALAIYVSDRHSPIIFRQVRVGRHGTEFTLYKFRSMQPVPATDSDIDWNPDRSVRVKLVGRIIRKTYIDELPQLWNVVRGDMSLVGPRPERPYFVEQFLDSIPSYGDRHRVNVGLTGWAAIHGLRGDTSIDDRAIYDNFYIENWSAWLDVKIVLLTLKSVIRGTGS